LHHIILSTDADAFVTIAIDRHILRAPHKLFYNPTTVKVGFLLADKTSPDEELLAS